MLTINDLTVKYGDHAVLFDFNLHLEAGSVHGLVGLNGSGKTTLLNTIYGLTKKDKGEILYDGHPLIRKKIAFLQTENYFYSTITGMEYLKFFLYYNPQFDLTALLKIFQLPLNELIDTYSTGMKKKLAIMANLILDKEIMIFDEPFNGLDIESVFILTRLIAQMKNRQKTVIITSHIIDTLTPVCDKIHWLQDRIIQKSFANTEFHLFKSALDESLIAKYDEKLFLMK